MAHTINMKYRYKPAALHKNDPVWELSSFYKDGNQTNVSSPAARRMKTLEVRFDFVCKGLQKVL